MENRRRSKKPDPRASDRFLCPPCSGINRRAFSDAWAADRDAHMAAARWELTQGRRHIAAELVRSARLANRKAVEIRRRMRSWP